MKLSRTVTGFLSVAILAFMVSDALGQGRRGQGGPGGQGRPGGGFGQRGGGGGDQVFGLLRIDEVKAEIELMPDQEEAIGKINENSRPERPDFNFREASEEDRQAFFEKMRKSGEERAKKMREQLEEVLLPEQIERLEEISLQVRGVAALRDEKVAAKLKITDDQKKKLEEEQGKIREEMRSKFQELMQSGDRDGMREAFAKMREDTEKQILGVLETSQQKKFEEMKGKKFEMPEGASGRGGFGGFGGRGGGRGGPGGGRGGAGGPGGRGGPGGGGRPRGQRPPTEE